ncbi:MAG: hypothetical protein Kow0070_24000 [Anaerolineales bacterium]
MKRLFIPFVLIAVVSLACSLTGAPTAETLPVETATSLPVQTEAATVTPVSGAESQIPIPLDAGAGTYKGLPLGLFQNPAVPNVTPVDGVIGVVCIGMSNASQECEDFIAKLSGEFAGQVNPQVRVVNCAVPGNAIEKWNDPAYDKLWGKCVGQRIPQAGLRPEQIRVVWHKAANMFTTEESGEAYPPYPDPNSDYFHFYENLTTFAARLHEKLPSVQAVYVTSRSYGGFASKESRGEPHSYEEGLALNAWLRDHPLVDGVWYGWGPYIWAPDCATGAVNGSGVCYERGDYRADGIHPEQGARDKISRMLHARFSQFEWYQP